MNETQPITPSYYLGVDNGKHGGLAVINEANDVVELISMPVYGTTTLEIDVQGIVSIFDKYAASLKLVTLESVFTMPATSRGVCQMLGRMLGLVEGITASHGIPYKIASPKEWQSKMFAYMSYPDTKTASITVAKRLQPNVDWNAGDPKPHDGLTDAYCLAVFGKQLMHA